jgi:hypothetical protein
MLHNPDNKFIIPETYPTVKPDTPAYRNKLDQKCGRLVRTWWHELVKTKATLRLSGGCFGCQILVSSDLLGELMLLDATGIS